MCYGIYVVPYCGNEMAFVSYIHVVTKTENTYNYNSTCVQSYTMGFIICFIRRLAFTFKPCDIV